MPVEKSKNSIGIKEAFHSEGSETEEEVLSEQGETMLVEEPKKPFEMDGVDGQFLFEKRPYPFDLEEPSLKKPCLMQQEMTKIPTLNSPFSQAPAFVPLLLTSYPTVAANAHYLQTNLLTIQDIKWFVINQLMALRANPSANFAWEFNNYKNAEKRALFDLAKQDNLKTIKEQFIDIIVANTNQYPTEFINKIFLNAVLANQHDMAVFFGIPKIRLLAQLPTQFDAELLINKEIYICKDDTSNEFIIGYKRPDGQHAQYRQLARRGKAEIATLRGSTFDNRLIPASDVRKILTSVYYQGADFPFRIGSSVARDVIQSAISKLLQSNAINIDLLEDLIECDASYESSYELNRFTNLIRYLAIWSIKEKRPDLFLLLLNSPLQGELDNNTFLLKAALTAIQTNNLAITDYLLKQVAFTLEQQKTLFWEAYKTASKDHLCYFLNNNQLMELVTKEENLTSFVYLSDYKRSQSTLFQSQQQFILALLNQGTIKNLRALLKDCLSSELYATSSWEIVRWLIDSPLVNHDFFKPFPDNAISLAITTQNPRLLTLIKEKGHAIETRWLDFAFEIKNLQQPFLILLMGYCYKLSPDNYYDGLNHINSNNWIKMALLYLSDHFDPYNMPTIETKLLNQVMLGNKSAILLLFNAMLQQADFTPTLKVLTFYAVLLPSQCFDLEPLKNNPNRHELVNCLISNPFLYNKLNAKQWLNKIAFSDLDSYALRVEICTRDFYTEYSKIFLCKKGTESDSFMPDDIWWFITYLAYQQCIHLLETTISLCDTLQTPDLDVVNGKTIKLHAHDNTCDLLFTDINKNQQCVKNIAVGNLLQNHSFFGNTNKPLTVLHLPAAAKQRIVDIVEENNGFLPDIRNS